MTPEDHNRYLGWAHIGYGVFHLLAMMVTGVALGLILSLKPSGGNGIPDAFLATVMVIVFGINILMTVPSFVAGYALLKRKPWAKIASIIAAVLSAMRFPYGTIVSVYSFWFLFSPPGRFLYDKAQLPPAPPSDWKAIDSRQENFAPPDWR